MQYLSPFPGHRKALRLQQREEQLRHALQNQHSRVKIEKAAENVRVAKLHLNKAFRFALFDRHPSEDFPKERLANLDRESEFWESRSIDDILDDYRE